MRFFIQQKYTFIYKYTFLDNEHKKKAASAAF